MRETRSSQLSVAEAEEIAIAAVQFLAANPEALGRFLALAGIGPQDLRAAAVGPEFLIGVIEFLMSDEALLLVFAESAGVRPTMIAAARFALARAAEPET